TIEKCVESLLKQVGNFSYQIIILDDGSSDGTLARLEKYQDNQLVEVVAKQNTGASATRNVGIEMAEMDSEYLIFVDADDFVEADYLKLLFDQFKDNSNCDL
ncbi:glycosyltransferase family A protein, partial [[Ruminococcus] torques]